MLPSLACPTTQIYTTSLWSTARLRYFVTIYIIIYLIKMSGYQTNGAGYADICGLCLSVSPSNISVVLRMIFIFILYFTFFTLYKRNMYFVFILYERLNPSRPVLLHDTLQLKVILIHVCCCFLLCVKICMYYNMKFYSITSILKHYRHHVISISDDILIDSEQF